MGRGVWSRVRKGRLVQVLAVYVGVSWVLLQVVGELRDTLELPPWIGPVALILLAVGLVIVLATAWVQSHPLLERRASADEVPGAWEVDLGELKEAVARGRLPHLTWSRAILGGAVAFSLLFGFAGLLVVLRDRAPLAPEAAIADEAAPGIAVLPFSATGPGVEFWREGMVDALSTNLDGLAGLRAIDSRTVLARWGEVVPREGEADLEAALEAGARTGARYALLGSVVSTGSRVQMVADVYQLEGERKLGTARVDGASDADSAFALVDGLTLEVLKLVPRPEGEEAPTVDLASLTTRSVEALRAYLEGETRFRSTEWRPAIAAYERALAADSTFALAHYRLSLAHGWDTFQSTLGDHDRAAARFAERLPERERLLVRGHLAYSRGRPAEALAALEEVTLRYPDDVEGWYLLGEARFHFGYQLLMDGVQASREPFERAQALDPAFIPAVLHLVDVAWDALDTAWIARIHREHPSEEAWARGSRLAFALAYGDSVEAEAAREALDDLPPDVAGNLFYRLRKPPLLPLQEEVLAGFRGRASYSPLPSPPDAVWRAWNAASRGHLAEVTAALADERVRLDLRRMLALGLATQGVPVPEAALDRVLALRDADSLPGPGNFAAAAWATERGRSSAARPLVERWRRMADSLAAAGEEAAGERIRGLAAGHEGHARWRSGDHEGALRLLMSAHGQVRGWAGDAAVNALLRLWIGQLLLELDRPDDAAAYLRSVSDSEPLVYPVTWLRLAEIHDARGEPDEAARWYARFTDVWSEADPELRPMVEGARRRLEGILAERG